MNATPQPNESAEAWAQRCVSTLATVANGLQDRMAAVETVLQTPPDIPVGADVGSVFLSYFHFLRSQHETLFKLLLQLTDDVDALRQRVERRRAIEGDDNANN